MCTYYYLHYHHIPPCMRHIDYAVHYNFCVNSTSTTVSVDPSETGSSGTGAGHQFQVTQNPCGELLYAPEYAAAEEGLDYNNPCAAGGCLVSQPCSSGQCRLEDLGGRWTCCRCNRGSNVFRWCAHPMRKVPDTLCYHVVCQGCWADPGGQ